MTIIDKLATSLNRKDEGPNEELAKDIADREDRGAVKNNRLVWGAMTALDAITLEHPEVIYAAHETIVNQLSMYAENAISIVNDSNKHSSSIRFSHDSTILKKTQNENEWRK